MESLKEFYNRFLGHFLAKDVTTATMYDKYLALAYAVRGHLTDRWIETQRSYRESNPRRVYYLSMEYVLGKSLWSNIIQLGIEKEINELAGYLGLSLADIIDIEDDFDLGNGGRGRLAACIQEAMATLDMPGMGYGLRYDYAAFRQEIRGGAQFECPNDWLHTGHPWESLRPERACEVGFGGATEAVAGETAARVWKPAEVVIAMPYDYPVPGYRNSTVNSIRLWSARASETFPSDYQHHGDYVRACEQTSATGTLTKILFPEENVLRALDIRLKQQYFFVAASVHDIVWRFKSGNSDILSFPAKAAIHLSGSRCAMAIPELLRVLVDEERVPWKTAVDVVQKTFTYTTYSTSRDHMETWPVYMMQQLFPRHMEIIYELNQQHLDNVRAGRKDLEPSIPQLSIVEEGEVKRVRMSPLALLGSAAVCGVSSAQREALTTRLLPQFCALMPEKFRTVTAGIAHRRWLLCANRPLANLVTQVIGDSWIRTPQNLSRLEQFAADGAFLDRLSAVKRSAKERLCVSIKNRLGVDVSPDALFDVHSKKIHPYKRQVLQILGILSRYLRFKETGEALQPRLYLFAGKASPSDRLAKQIVRLIHITADIVKADPAASQLMQVVFVPDYCMSWAERIIPAAELSEQIPTPGFEASGTSNMKFALNGAVGFASQAGSNLEVINKLGAENLFVFGKSDSEQPPRNAYRPGDIIRGNPRLAAVFDFLDKHLPSVPEGHAVYPLLASLRDSDEYYVLLDYEDYVAKQGAVDELYRSDEQRWNRMALAGIARMGWFSSDRTAAEYAEGPWRMDSVRGSPAVERNL